jgi:glycerol uptake facilitator-like aquaporin
VGTALLVAAVVGSGIMAERLSGGSVGLALLANALATGGVLAALILTFGPISGGHFNPAVTLADASQGGLSWRAALLYIPAQIIGGFAGVAAAHLMFGEPLFTASTHVRAGAAQAFSEGVATFGLLSVIWGVSRSRAAVVPFAVAAYIVGAYWFTASTSFANPAMTLARAATGSTKSGLVDPEYFHVFAEMTRRFPNLYGDTSAFNVPMRGRHIRKCIVEPLLSRMVHGSDFPVPVNGLWAWLRGFVSWKAYRQAQRNPNILERDYQLKVAMGFPPETFTRISKLLRLA